MMEEERIPKKVLNGNFHTTRPVGRPKTRWADVVQREALQLLGTRGWRRRATKRDKCRRLVREAKAPKGHGWWWISKVLWCEEKWNYRNVLSLSSGPFIICKNMAKSKYAIHCDIASGIGTTMRCWIQELTYLTYNFSIKFILTKFSVSVHQFH
jgi:hypothetical protein